MSYTPRHADRRQAARDRRRVRVALVAALVVVLAVLGGSIAYGATQTTTLTVTVSDASGKVLSTSQVQVPLPVVTVTATPSPLPTTPSPDPTTPAPGDVIADLVLSSGQHDLLYENKTFRSTKAQQATLTITKAYNVTFRNCVIEGSQWNGVTINDSNGSVHDVTFENCLIMSTARMGFECTSRPNPTTSGYYHVNLIRCVVEPAGAEGISYDGVGPHDCLIQDCTILGAGNNTAFSWGQGFEINGPTNFTVDGLTIFRTRSSNFNLSGRGQTGWRFSRIRIDNTVNNLSVARNGDANAIYANNMDGAVWSGTITNAPPGGAMAYLTGCNGNDFSGLTVSGSPTSWQQVNGSSGNTF